MNVVQERIRKASELRMRLVDVLSQLERDQPSVGQLLQLIEETVAMNEPMTPEQFEELKEQLRRRAGKTKLGDRETLEAVFTDGGRVTRPNGSSTIGPEAIAASQSESFARDRK